MDELSVVLPAPIQHAQRLANLTDTAVRIPVLGIPVGLDFIIGLIPGAGDLVMFIVSLSIIVKARQAGAPKSLRMAMVRNSLIDFVVGSVPIVGDLFDLFFKANRRNVRMLEKWWVQENHTAIRDNARVRLDAWQSEQDNQGL